MTTTDQSTHEAVRFTDTERSIVTVLAGIYTTRMLGLFLLLPVLSLYAARLPGSTPTMVGLTMAAYPLVQMVLQIPFGRWSDRYGRRPVIATGLVLFLLGSIVGAFSTSLWGVILGRGIQGAGAISAAVTALLADCTREVMRTRAMAFIGISIGASFVISLVAAPVLDAAIGVRGIFWIMAAMSLGGLLLLRWGIAPQGERTPQNLLNSTSLVRVALLPQLRSYYVGVFALHFILGSTFLAVPQVLVHSLGIAEFKLWQVYLGVFAASLPGTYLLIRRVERTARSSGITLAAISIAAFMQAMLGMYSSSLWMVLVLFAMFFTAFNFLEARLPSGLSKAAPSPDRGAALGVFATMQSFGAACGPAIGGQIAARAGYPGVFWLSAGMALIWVTVNALSPNES